MMGQNRFATIFVPILKIEIAQIRFKQNNIGIK